MRTLVQSFSKYSIYLTFFLDNLGLGIIFPIFTPLLFDPSYGFLKNAHAYTDSSILLGILIACFPLAQFFGAPLIGDLSDQIGRKKAFILTISGSIFGYILLATSIKLRSLPLLFISRMMTGLFAGNLTVCLASLVDMSKNESERSKNFSLLATIGGIGFICSVSLGGFFSNPMLSELFGPSLPFWIVACLFAINLLLIITFFDESHHCPKNAHFKLFKGIHNILHAWEIPSLKKAYLTFFFYVMTWVTTIQFLPTNLLKYFDFSGENITYVFIGIGFFWGFANFIFSRFFSKKYSPSQTLCLTLGTLTLLLLAYFFSIELPFTIFLSLFYISVLFSAVSWSNCLTNVSLQASPDVQGKILGINQSFAATAAIFGPILGGVIANISPRSIFLFTSCLCFIGFLIVRQKHSCDNHDKKDRIEKN